jgi:hypothetical protein
MISVQMLILGADSAGVPQWFSRKHHVPETFCRHRRRISRVIRAICLSRIAWAGIVNDAGESVERFLQSPCKRP